ncbi:MAG: cysteine desulfurase CsdA [Candidatus Neomarinimicrobiota bacterium]|nr:MAG: cysteine desulfurase CsdA [Candidatus Neomarinimicrobiota bacterium]
MRALQETGDRRQEAGEATLDVREIREMFPLLAGTVGGKPLAYLDNAATTQKPRVVLDTLSRYYAAENANIHRGVYQLSQNATQAYEGARGKVAAFLNAAEPAEIIFTRNATEGINLVAQTFGRWQVGEGDDVVISTMEHHSNIVPWQMLCEEKGARLRVVPITDAGELMLDELASLLGPRTKLVSIVHMSNSLGTINPVRQVVELAHAQGIPVLIDGSQAAYHMAVDVQAIGCDFYVVTGHKLYGPTGIGALYGQRRWLEAMPPYQGGGDMISSVTFERTTYNKVPHKFEAGTPHIAGAIGLGAAVDFIRSVGFEAIAGHERRLLDYATDRLSAVPGLRLIGTAREKVSILSFVLDGVHAHDIGTIVDTEGVAIRTGHHCTQPVMARFNVPATARASLAMYNTVEEIDQLVTALTKVREIFG